MRGLGTTSSIPEESDPEEIHSEVKPTSHNRNHDHKGSRTRASGSTSTLQHIADRVETHKAHGLSSRSFSTACLRDPSSDSATVSSTEHLATPNSSSTIYVDQTITNLGKRAMVTGLCNCVWSRINSPSPLDDTVVARRPSTTAEALQHIDRDAHEFATSGVDAVAADIRKYVERLFRELALDDGIAVVALIYLDRIERHAGLAVTRQTWKWLLSGAMLTAVKIWDDVAFWLADFPQSANVDIATLNAVERAVLALLRYDVSASPREYAEAYFVLRDHVPGGVRVPLDKERAKQLGLVSPRLPQAPARRRSNSVDSTAPASSQPRKLSLATLPIP